MFVVFFFQNKKYVFIRNQVEVRARTINPKSFVESEYKTTIRPKVASIPKIIICNKYHWYSFDIPYLST